ncbi:MAG: DoxX family membrane protein [Nanoarchaeota archaeon]|nr:DoxX family membrane protein [Nanoarchaeota archaeon]
MVNKVIVQFLEDGKKNGFGVSSLTYELVKKGYNEEEINEAVYFTGNEASLQNKFGNKYLEYIRIHRPIFLRISMGLMYIWFGINQLIYPDSFLKYIPAYTGALFSPLTVVYLNGIFEILLSTVLLFGFFVRSSALLLSLHLYFIGFSVVDSGIMVRDVALATALFVVFLNGNDKWCLSEVLKRKRKR